RCDIIVVDDIGLLPVEADTAEAFYRLVDAAHERRSLAVTSNIHPSGFDTIMPKTMATATVDRLMHHAHLVETSGESHRLAEALAGRGVIPLATKPDPNRPPTSGTVDRQPQPGWPPTPRNSRPSTDTQVAPSAGIGRGRGSCMPPAGVSAEGAPVRLLIGGSRLRVCWVG